QLQAGFLSLTGAILTGGSFYCGLAGLLADLFCVSMVHQPACPFTLKQIDMAPFYMGLFHSGSGRSSQASSPDVKAKSRPDPSARLALDAVPLGFIVGHLPWSAGPFDFGGFRLVTASPVRRLFDCRHRYRDATRWRSSASCRGGAE
uniref:Derlin n=1 Tax=Macrostomum lignano TaxID=282301 RepID=A0A1I8FEC2_9PLAT